MDKIFIYFLYGLFNIDANFVTELLYFFSLVLLQVDFKAQVLNFIEQQRCNDLILKINVNFHVYRFGMRTRTKMKAPNLIQLWSRGCQYRYVFKEVFLLNWQVHRLKTSTHFTATKWYNIKSILNFFLLNTLCLYKHFSPDFCSCK